MRHGFRLARSQPLTEVTKSNAQRHGSVIWEKVLVGAMNVQIVKNPQSLETIVAANLHADMLPDLAGSLAASLAVAPTASIDPERRFPAIFEPIHGPAFDLAARTSPTRSPPSRRRGRRHPRRDFPAYPRRCDRVEMETAQMTMTPTRISRV